MRHWMMSKAFDRWRTPSLHTFQAVSRCLCQFRDWRRSPQRSCLLTISASYLASFHFILLRRSFCASRKWPPHRVDLHWGHDCGEVASVYCSSQFQSRYEVLEALNVDKRIHLNDVGDGTLALNRRELCSHLSLS